MKKAFKIIFINIVVIFLMLVLLETLSFCILFKMYFNTIWHLHESGYSVISIINSANSAIFDKDNYWKYYRKPIFLNNEEPGIVIFGGSFAYGATLDINDSLGGQISKLVNRNVYTRARGGIGTQEMLYQLESGDLLKFSNNIDTFIYVYIKGHCKRNVKYRCWPFINYLTLAYKLDKNGNLSARYPNSILERFYISRGYDYMRPSIVGQKNLNKIYYLIIKKSFEEMKRQYKNVNFIILAFDDMPYYDEISQLGINVIYLNDLTGVNLHQLKYQISEYDGHPNKDAFRLIAEKLVENKIIQ